MLNEFGGNGIVNRGQLEDMEWVIDYLASRGYLGGVPDGYVLVPKEPTDEMLNAPSTIIQTYGAGLIWQRMIAAAPKGEMK